MTKLLYPYTYEERTPVYKDGVLFIPEYFKEGDDQKHLSFQDDAFYRVLSHPSISLEICSGTGAWICQMAKMHPEKLFLACEIRYDRVKKIYKRIQVEGISNLIICFGYAEDLVEFYLKPSSINEIYVNFPDPWPKKRHAKHRLFQDKFINNLKKIMKPGASLVLATDDQTYIEESIQNLMKSGLKPSFDCPFFQALDHDYGFSFFQDLWIAKGKTNLKTIFHNL